MLFREAKISDLDSLVRLGYLLAKHEKMADPLLKLDTSTLKQSKTHYTKELRNKNAKFFVAETTEGKIVGYQYGYILNAPSHIIKYKKMGHLEAGFVEEQYRGKKIGKKLTLMMINWFKKQNISLIELGVYSQNIKSVEIWRKLGFKDNHIEMRKII